MRRLAVALALLAAAAAPWWLAAGRGGPPFLLRTWSVSYALVCLSWTGAAAAAGGLLLGRGGRRERALGVLAAAIGVGVSLALAEAPAVLWGHDWGRTLGTEGERTWLDQALAHNRPDPELIHLHWPHARFEGRVQGNLAGLGIPSAPWHEVDVRFDRNGFRNDTELERADVVLIGDSFVEGSLVALEETVGQQLAVRLGVPVANLGQSAYGLAQELAVLRRYGLPLAPRTVLWFLFGGNDLRDVDHYAWQRAHFEEITRPRTPSLGERLFVRNALLALSRTALARFESPRARAQSAHFRRADGAVETVYFGDTEGPWKPHEWDAMTATLGEANRLSAGAGVQLVVVYIPRKFRVYRPHLSFIPDSETARWDVNDLPGQLGDWCREAGVPFVDTTPILEAEVARGVHTYFVDDVHWNARGHAVVAEALAQRLAAEPPVPEAPRTEAR